MIYRLTIESGTVVIEGLLDREALVDALARCRASSAGRLVLRAGTIIRAECIATLAETGIEVVAESPYLARWLERARAESRRP